MAQITIDATTEQSQRISVAVGKRIGAGRNATAGEVKQFLIDYLKSVVLQSEREDLATQALNLT